MMVRIYSPPHEAAKPPMTQPMARIIIAAADQRRRDLTDPLDLHPEARCQ
jgi:hypothetical protein